MTSGRPNARTLRTAVFIGATLVGCSHAAASSERDAVDAGDASSSEQEACPQATAATESDASVELVSSCAPMREACAASADCMAIAACVRACDEATYVECRADCRAQHAAAIATFEHYDRCLDRCVLDGAPCAE